MVHRNGQSQAQSAALDLEIGRQMMLARKIGLDWIHRYQVCME